ncbi:3-deoxy-D-manno-octulosonic acid transferase [Niabella sp. CC-SYL272]|uniref:3-deoxy-D-manno-octulosonic acid transferase n=1 Tax=Niabella agricola TaxID=2891571 RepID=UPI001F39F62E|nr:glycosyltransferase N-terminal domain-containing protein [Niabella agricola]MCF3108594.1 3-deoxy-D-manno-octulosonic acid transferase [Niabella agricola]
MSRLLYLLFLYSYRVAIFIASFFNRKAGLWRSGRKHLLQRLEEALGGNKAPVIWVHCASLGEFEQGRTILETLKKEYPDFRVLLTFFSPSGYEIRKNYANADWVFYLPLDTPYNARRFVQIVKPSLALFVKYEYWYHLLQALKKTGTPTLLVSALFRENAIFFKPYGSFHRKMLRCFTHIFVQDMASKSRLAAIIPAEQVTVAGDTRFDRVVQIAAEFTPIPLIETFINQKSFVIVAGSTWPDDERHLASYLKVKNNNTSLIIAPHEINKEHIDEILSRFPGAQLFSKLKEEPLLKGDVLIIDNIGMLSRLYYYAAITYIGGGFNKAGIHNTLEAAVFFKPVIFGPNYQKFAEAKTLIKNGGATSYSNEGQLVEIIETLKNNLPVRETSGRSAGRFVAENTGATAIISGYIRENLR